MFPPKISQAIKIAKLIQTPKNAPITRSNLLFNGDKLKLFLSILKNQYNGINISAIFERMKIELPNHP